MKKLRTNKRPFLFKNVEEAWNRWGSEGLGRGSSRESIAALRDACAVVVGFFYGCRAGELTSFKMSDLRIEGDIVHLTFRSRKNRRSVLGLHQHQKISASHPLLLLAVTTWTSRARTLGANDGTPLFPKTSRGQGPVSLRNTVSIAPASIRFRCKAIEPLCVAHSLRAGMATEAWAAGVPIEAIMALGGWNSPVAVMYICGATEETVCASRRLGSAKMRFDGDNLHATLGTARLNRSTWITS